MKTAIVIAKESEKGFTLIEVLICIGIFAIGFLAMAVLQVNSMRGDASARDFTEASVWADNRVENLLSKDYTHADLTPGSHSRFLGGYTIKWDVVESDLNADGVPDLKEVNLLLTTQKNGMTKHLISRTARLLFGPRRQCPDLL
jgi:prepilin-type N-terminal cleavage/methylation domain-containing protein